MEEIKAAPICSGVSLDVEWGIRWGIYWDSAFGVAFLRFFDGYAEAGFVIHCS